MKHLSALLLAAFPLFLSAQTIRVVSNQAIGLGAFYTNIQSAVDASSNGDIIYVYPSSVNYSSANISKKLTILGPGYQTLLNPSLGIQTYIGDGTLENITFLVGSEGSLIMGCNVNQIHVSNASNIILQRNKIRYNILINNSSNVLVTQSYFDYSDGGGFYLLQVQNNCSSIIVRNNIFHGTHYLPVYCGWQCNYTDNLQVDGSCNAQIENNIFHDRVQINNSTFRNNISYYDNFSNTNEAVAATNCIIYDNVFHSPAALPTGSYHNLTNVPLDSLFVGYPTQGAYSFDSRFQLLPYSPAKGYATGGVDCGAYGGVELYKLSGLPFIPLIYQINAPNAATSSSGLNVNIKVRAEN